jgi:iron complex outermembrane receptor protein
MVALFLPARDASPAPRKTVLPLAASWNERPRRGFVPRYGPRGCWGGEVGLRPISLWFCHKRLIALRFVLPVLTVAGLFGAPAHAQTLEELREMSIEDLAEVNVSSVSKTDQPLGDAPAAIYVIDRDDIIRSGAATLPEMLRLAPNIQVYQTSPSSWVVTARGLNGNLEAQNFSNKLLVLIDGRPVYTALFSGVYWDMPDVLPDNIDRIEVISGPGAALWGANAVNGVINVITRRASETRGLYADIRAGPDRQAIGARISGAMGDDLSFAVHGRLLREDHAYTAAGDAGEDNWRHLQGRLQLDWTPSAADRFTFEAGIFDGREHLPGDRFVDLSGRHATLDWNREFSGGEELQVQAFYDRISRNDQATGGGKFHTDTYDLELQHNFTVGAHSVVWGGGARLVDYDIEGTDALFFDPPSRTLFIGNAFVQDSFALTDDLTLIGGLKLERLPYSGVSLLPEARIAWKVAPTTLVWAAVQRAVRSPTPFDVDVEERAGGIIAISGNPVFRTEKLTAFELGTRLQPAPTFSLSATAFWHLYDDLRSIEFTPGPFLLNLTWGNQLKGSTYGVEAWADWRVAPWWTLALGATVLERDFAFKPGSSELLGTGQTGNDPPYKLTVRSSMNLRRDVSLDLNFRALGALEGSTVPAVQELGGRLAWQASSNLTLSVSGTNLLHDRHQEYPGGALIPRRVMGGVELSF